jgi:hypothetical protein
LIAARAAINTRLITTALSAVLGAATTTAPAVRRLTIIQQCVDSLNLKRSPSFPAND